MDPVVQAIQVASALLERVMALMHPGAGHEFMSRVVGGDNGLELSLGEAQQTMPEVWGHLERARDMIAGAGKDVREFDRIRGGLKSQLASTDIDVTRHVDFRGRTHTVKTVHWDMEGVRRALAARDALRRVRSDVDWAGLERQQAQELAAMGSLGGAKWIGLAKAAGAIAAVIGIVYAIRAFG